MTDCFLLQNGHTGLRLTTPDVVSLLPAAGFTQVRVVKVKRELKINKERLYANLRMRYEYQMNKSYRKKEFRAKK